MCVLFRKLGNGFEEFGTFLAKSGLIHVKELLNSSDKSFNSAISFLSSTKALSKLDSVLRILPISSWLCIKPRIQERGTKCGNAGNWGMLCTGECHQTYQGMPWNILRHILENSGGCPQAFWWMLPNILENVVKHSGVFDSILNAALRNIFQDIPQKCYSELHLEFYQTSTMKLFCKNSQRP